MSLLIAKAYKRLVNLFRYLHYYQYLNNKITNYFLHINSVFSFYDFCTNIRSCGAPNDSMGSEYNEKNYFVNLPIKGGRRVFISLIVGVKS
jgi:hypothetical protein